MIKKLSIVIPVYNEERTIVELLRRVEAARLGSEKEIIIVDDGSFDGTREILNGLDKNRYKIFFHEKNLGKGAAVRTGFKHATGDYAVIQDADLEYDPNDLKKMIEFAEKNGAGVVYGSRRLGKPKSPTAGWQYYWGGVFLAFLTNFLYGTKITDEATCYKMFSRDILKDMEIKGNGFEWEPEITAKIARRKIPIYEIPISYAPRSVEEGKKIKLKDGLVAIWILLKYRVLS